jgi:hypothetical protein
MTAFPSYKSDERSYDLGVNPVMTQQGWACGTLRFRTGATRVGAVLRLTLRRLVAATVVDIRDHYAGQVSGGELFGLK